MIETKNTDDLVTFDVDGNTTMFEVRSPSGIGSARVAANEGNFTAPSAVRFYLGGLENMTLVYGDVVQTLSVSSGDPELIMRSIQIGSGPPQDVQPDSPDWMDVHQGADPLTQEPYYVVSLPAALIEAGASEFEISWIDFYR
jgi:hypothetical protein